MPKKITMVSAVAAVLLAGVIFAAVKMLPKTEKFALPEQISVLFPERNEIRIIDGEEFLAGCVRGQVQNAGYPLPEALKAVAAAQKTKILFTLKNKSPAENRLADLTAGEDFPYIDKLPEKQSELSREIDEAIDDLPELLINGEPFDAQICRISAGRTDPSEHSPSVTLPGDAVADGCKSVSGYTPEEVWQALGRPPAPYDPSEWFTDAVYADTGTLISINFCGREFSGSEIRSALSLRSTAISPEYREDMFFITCKGLGNNKGLSVNSASILAETGLTTQEILDIFFRD